MNDRTRRLFWNALNVALAVITLWAAFASISRADCRPFFGHRSYGSAYHAPHYSYHVHKDIYFSAGPFVEAKAALAYEKAKDPDYREFRDFKTFKADYAEFQEYRAAAERAPKIQGAVMAQKCASCHDAQSPEKGITFDGAKPIDAAAVTKALRQIRDDKMPPDGGLSDDEKAALMEELLTLESTPQAKPEASQ